MFAVSCVFFSFFFLFSFLFLFLFFFFFFLYCTAANTTQHKKTRVRSYATSFLAFLNLFFTSSGLKTFPPSDTRSCWSILSIGGLCSTIVWVLIMSSGLLHLGVVGKSRSVLALTQSKNRWVMVSSLLHSGQFVGDLITPILSLLLSALCTGSVQDSVIQLVPSWWCLDFPNSFPEFLPVRQQW